MIKTLILTISIAILSFSTLVFADDNIDKLKEQIEQLKKDNQKLARREKFSEVVVLRGSPGNEQRQTLTVFIPESASNIQVKAYMKNEIWGGQR